MVVAVLHIIQPLHLTLDRGSQDRVTEQLLKKYTELF